MKDREFEFRRKDDYKDEVIAWIKCLKERHEDILFIPNTDCIKGYYKGLVLYEKITDRCRNLVRRCSDKPLLCLLNFNLECLFLSSNTLNIYSDYSFI